MIDQLNHQTVAIFDDDATIRKTVKSLLEKAGYTCLTASTLTEAACILGKHRGHIDTIIADFEFQYGLNISLLAESMKKSKAQVFVLTSHNTSEIQRDYPSLAYANFRSKANPLSELMSALEK